MSRARVSAALACAGVILWIVSALLPAEWHPAVPFLAGVLLLGVSEWLTPCKDQITRWWRARVSR